MRWTPKASGAELGLQGGHLHKRSVRELSSKTQTSDAFADGEVVWFWRTLLASREEPVIQIRMPELSARRWQNEFVTGKSTKETVKTIAQGMSECLR